MTLFKHTAIGVSPGEAWSFGVHTEGSGSLASAQASWVDAIGDLWTGEMDALMPAEVTLAELTTASLDQSTGGQISRVSTGSALPGTAAGPMIPYQCSVCVSLTTDLATRSGRGRFYLPPFDASTLDDGRLSATAQATLVGAVGAWWAALDGAGLAVQLYSRTTKALTPVTGMNVGDVFDTQRRRRNKLIEVRQSVTAP